MRRPGQESEAVNKLREAIVDSNNGLTRSDRDFGASLVSAFDRYGLTPKQEPWVITLLERAEASSTTGTMKPQAAKHTTQQLGSVAALFKLFDTAKANHLKWPTIKVLVDGKRINLTYSENLDAISVREKESNGEKIWLAGLKRDGVLTLSTRYTAPAGLTQTLLEFAADPSKAGGVMGKKMRSCCFCGADLTSKDSLYYGYGPICAGKWGLEWGEAKERLKEEAIAQLPQSFI